MLGHYSHGTSHSFLGAAEGTEFMRTWKLPTPTKIVDKLKAVLLGEMASAEWELLEEKEWDDETQEQPHANPEDPPEPLPPVDQRDDVNDKPSENNTLNTVTTGSMMPDGDSNAHERMITPPTQSNSSRSKGTSGWTKLKSR
jgi:hypothetical protein